MPKNSPIPRLSIVVPIGRDLAAFECTLISVLENQPTDCEVLVAHDGNYDDPFELCDELEFVTADSNELVDLVSAGAWAARGRYVHFLADGVRATTNWADEALEKFEHADAAVVAPVIRHAASNRIIAAGWCDGVDRLCSRARHGLEHARAKSPQLIGAYLQASFWRRDIIRSLSQGVSSRQSEDLAYAYEHLIRAAGWRCVLAEQCNLLSDTPVLPWESNSPSRGSRLRSIRNHFGRGGWSRSISAATRAVLANALCPKQIPEALGQAMAPLAGRELAEQLRSAKIPQCDPVMAGELHPGQQITRRVA